MWYSVEVATASGVLGTGVVPKPAEAKAAAAALVKAIAAHAEGVIAEKIRSTPLPDTARPAHAVVAVKSDEVVDGAVLKLVLTRRCVTFAPGLDKNVQTMLASMDIGALRAKLAAAPAGELTLALKGQAPATVKLGTDLFLP